jgi:hypothetical protein
MLVVGYLDKKVAHDLIFSAHVTPTEDSAYSDLSGDHYNEEVVLFQALKRKKDQYNYLIISSVNI